VLFRADAPHPGDAPPALTPWPPRTVLDLRSAGESGASHPLAGPDTDVVSLPLLEAANPARMAADPDAAALDLGAIYLDILTRGAPTVVRLAELVAERPAPVLVHCSAGKDRTGVSIAVLLLAAGVPPEAVAEDYRRTEANMPAVARRLAEAWQGDDAEQILDLLTRRRPDLLEAPAFAIDTVVETVAGGPAGAAGWLTEHGLRPAQLDALRARLVVDQRP
jgi:hypothetical protein